MKKYNKKVALILALALTLAIAVPVLAYQTDIKGTYTGEDIQEIKVAVSGGTSVKAILNKTADDVYVNGTDTTAGVLKASGQITSFPIVGVNMGKSKLDVRATVTSAPSGNFKFTSSAPKKDAKNTNALVYLEAQPVDVDLGYNETNSNADYGLGLAKFDVAKVVKAMNDWKTTAGTNDNRAKLTSDAKKSKVVLKKGTATSKNPIVTMEPASDTAYTYFLARLSGWIGNGGDAKKGKDWKADDGFGAYVIWTFETAQSE